MCGGVCVCVCGCGWFGNMCTCIDCVLYCLYSTATEWQLKCSYYYYYYYYY